MKCTASAVIAIAKEEIGYLEKKSGSGLGDKTANVGSGNYTKYARDLDAIEGFYNGKKQGFPWCDVFVDWVLTQAFGAEKAKALLCQPDKSYGAGVWAKSYDLDDPKICGYGRPDYDPASFADVPESAWYAEAAEYCLAQGLMVGVGAEKFEPNRPVTRAELAAVAARMHKGGTL